MNRKLLVPALALVLALLSCTLPVEPVPPTATIAPTLTPPPAPTTPAGLTLDMLRNGRYTAAGCNGSATEAYQLTDGKYQSSADPSSPGYASVLMTDVTASGDLNGDGLDDAGLILGVNCGGSGVFESLIVVVNAGGSPRQAGQAELGDRVLVKSMGIAAGKVTLDMQVQGPNDPLCCPSLPEVQTYRLVEGRLWLGRVTTRAPSGEERAINISDPADRSTVANPFAVSGSVTIAPFENTLAYRLYLPDGTKVNESPLMVSAASPGAPGTFSLPLDLSNAGITGTLIVQIMDLSAADGTTQAMDSVVLSVH